MDKIIVPTDFSPTAGAALRYAFFLAEATGFGLEVLHVHDGYGHSDAPGVKKRDMEASTTAQRHIDDFIRFNLKITESVVGEDAEESSDVIISSREITGTPTDALVAASRNPHTRLIVMGGVGTGVVSTVTSLFGSVAGTVAERASCPVLMVPEHYGQPVLLRASIAFGVVSALRETSKKFDFLRVALAPAMHMVHVRDASDEVETRTEDALIEEVMTSDFPGYHMEVDLLDPGVTAVQLLKYAFDEDIDLLVMGRRKRSVFKRLFVRSDMGMMLEHSGTPILIIPISDE